MRKLLLALAGLSVAFAQVAYCAAPKNIKNTTITISLGSDLETMDPHTSTSALTTTLHRYLFDTLMHRPNGADLVPWAAKEFKQIDPKTLEFRMREGVTFSNGEDVDAQAVRYSLMRPLQPGFKTVLTPLFRVIDRVDVVSKWVVRVYMKTSDPGLLRRLADFGHLVPPRHYSRLSQEDAAVKPVGSGPYRLVRWEKGVEIVFEANPDYWKAGAPHVKTVRVVPIKEDGTKVAALLKGEVDLINQVPAQYIEKLKAGADTRVEIVRGTRVFHVGFTHGIDSPLKDIRVRKAVAHAIDRDVLVKHVVEGHGIVANQPLHQWTEGYDAKRAWPYAFDPQKSRQLLAEAGFPNGLEIDFITPEGRYTKDKEVAQAIAGMLQSAGIKVRHQSVVWRRFVETFNARNNPGAKPFLYYIGYGNGTGDSDASISAVAACKGAWSGYCNPEVDKALDEAASTTDLKKRNAIFSSITQTMANDVSHVMLWQEDSVYGMRKSVVWNIRNDDRVYGWELDRK
jgi:peptide/nickel transport system substrate-binding protein